MLANREASSLRLGSRHTTRACRTKGQGNCKPNTIQITEALCDCNKIQFEMRKAAATTASNIFNLCGLFGVKRATMKTVELRAIFAWDCDECGVENIDRCPDREPSELTLEGAATVAVVAGPPVAQLIDEECSSAQLIARAVLISPRFVKCRKCGAEYKSNFYERDCEQNEAT